MSLWETSLKATRGPQPSAPISRFSRDIAAALHRPVLSRLALLLAFVLAPTLTSPTRADAPKASSTRATLTTSTTPPPELATPAPTAAPCLDCSTSDEGPTGPGLFIDHAWRGVALADLPADVGFDAPALDAATRAVNPAGFRSIASVSVVSTEHRRLVLMIVGRADRFDDDTTRAHRRVLGPGGLGVALFEYLVPAHHTPIPTADDFALLEEHPLAALRPRLLVSLVDRTLVLELEGLHIRRVLPVGVGALDPVRSHPAISSLTPITERARISKTGAHLALNGSSWARGLPYIPLEVPWVATAPAPLNTERLHYAETRLAFHAWPGQRFMRGFNSHGCITLRDADLLELTAFVFGSSTPLSLTIREAPLEARHPLPHENKQFWRLVNTGTPDRPAFSLRGTLYFLERLREPIPDLSGFVGRFMDSERQAYKRGRLARTSDAGIPDSLIP